MSRIRYLKPEFFLDEDVAELSFAARLLFQGLWVLADRAGRLEDRATLIRVQVFPYDNAIAIGELLDELARERKHSPGAFIRRYTVGSQRYIQINSFAAHQKPHPREAPSVIPEYQGTASPKRVRPSRAKVLPSRVKDMPSRMGKGMGNGEGNGELEGGGKEHIDPPATEAPPTNATPAEARAVALEALGPPDPPREIPPDEKAELDIRAQGVVLVRRLYTAVGRLSERTGQDSMAVMRTVTAYKREDGTEIKGRSNPAGLTAERLEKSVEDAEGWLADLERESA